MINGDTSLSYKFTPLFSSGLFFNTSYNTFENGTDSRVFAGGLTGAYRFSPAFTVDARAGASHMKETSTVREYRRTRIHRRTAPSPWSIPSGIFVPPSPGRSSRPAGETSG